MALSIPTETFSRFDRLSFISGRAARAGLGGEHRSRRPASSTDFVDYRPYQPGDDFRRVDWNVYGRLGSLQVKITEGRERLDLVVVLDCSSSMDYGRPDKLTFAAQLTAALSYIGAARSDSVRIACLSGPPTAPAWGPFARRGRIPRLVEQLSRIAPAGLVDLDQALAACLPTSGSSTPLLVVVSDLLTPAGVGAALEALQGRRADVVVVHVVSPDELDPRLSGEVELVDAETNATLEVGVSLATLAAYRERFERWLEDRAAECTRRGIRYARVRTDHSLATVVMDDLRRAGVLR